MHVNEMSVQVLRELNRQFGEAIDAAAHNMRQLELNEAEERECSTAVARHCAAVIEQRNELAAFLRNLCDERGHDQEWVASALALLERTGNRRAPDLRAATEDAA